MSNYNSMYYSICDVKLIMSNYEVPQYQIDDNINSILYALNNGEKLNKHTHESYVNMNKFINHMNNILDNIDYTITVSLITEYDNQSIMFNSHYPETQFTVSYPEKVYDKIEHIREEYDELLAQFNQGKLFKMVIYGQEVNYISDMDFSYFEVKRTPTSIFI